MSSNPESIASVKILLLSNRKSIIDSQTNIKDSFCHNNYVCIVVIKHFAIFRKKELFFVNHNSLICLQESSVNYNLELEQLKSQFNRIDYEWLKSVISEDGSLYELAAYNIEDETNDILQENYSAVAWDEHIDYYTQKSMDAAYEIYSLLWDNFSMESDAFLSEIEKILSALIVAISFTKKWKASKINPALDNT